MHLYVAITMYEDKVFGKCAESVMRNFASLQQKGHKVTPFFLSELYIDRARNICVDNFLKTECTDLLFVDADLSFEDDAMLKIIEHDRAIVAGAYRLKQVAELYTSTVIDWEVNNNNCKEEETGLVWVKSAPAGFMRVQRHVFEKMKKHYDMKPDHWGVHHFFETGMKVFNDGQWWGEDTAFCKKWRDMGGQIMVEPRLNFTHIGNQDFTGNFHEHLMGRKVKSLDEDSLIEQLTNDIQMIDYEMKIVKGLASKGGSVIEVGCWKGKTTKELLEVCNKVYAVDHFQGTTEDISGSLAKKCDVYKEFKNNVGNHPNLIVLKGDSVKMADSLNGEKADMVFIDAGHKYDEIKADIKAWLPRAKKIISGHDYCKDFPGVVRAVDEFAKDRDVKVDGSVWWCKL